jgi:hypothetical protein
VQIDHAVGNDGAATKLLVPSGVEGAGG